jgi:hypothetical protein
VAAHASYIAHHLDRANMVMLRMIPTCAAESHELLACEHQSDMKLAAVRKRPCAPTAQSIIALKQCEHQHIACSPVRACINLEELARDSRHATLSMLLAMLELCPCRPQLCTTAWMKVNKPSHATPTFFQRNHT